jgi:addiction module HigA family antidote
LHHLTAGKKATIAPNPPHPGVILQEEMTQAGLGARDLADALKVPASRITQILSGERSISADTASRLERFFGAPAKCWLEDQNEYDLWHVNRSEIERDVNPMPHRQPKAEPGK